MNEYTKSAERVMSILESRGCHIVDRKRFLAEVMQTLEACHNDVKQLGGSNGEMAGLQMLKMRSSHRRSQPDLLHSLLGNSFPKLNNIPGRGHGFNGIGALPSKTDILTAAFPIEEKESRTVHQVVPSKPWQLPAKPEIPSSRLSFHS